MKTRTLLCIGVVICMLLTGLLMTSLAAAEQGGPAISDGGGPEFSAQPVGAIAHSDAMAIIYNQLDGLAEGSSADGITVGEIAEAAVTNDARPVESFPPDLQVAQNLFFETGDSNQSTRDVEQEQGVAEPDIADPLEPLNRVFFTVNDKLYFWVLKPAANAYSFFVPEWGRVRVRNVFHNFRAPMRLVNALLQVKMHAFGAEFASFVLNSTVGIGGLFDIAARHPELKTNEEDFGQTLGYYGVGDGFYLVLPVIGPLSLRDTVGWGGDSLLDPVWYVSPFLDAFAIQALKRVNDTSFVVGDYEDIKESALDPYISIKDIYQQYRRNKLRE